MKIIAIISLSSILSASARWRTRRWNNDDLHFRGHRADVCRDVCETSVHLRKRLETELSEHADTTRASSNDADTSRQRAQRWPLEPQHGTQLATTSTGTQKLSTTRSTLKLTNQKRGSCRPDRKGPRLAASQSSLFSRSRQNPGLPRAIEHVSTDGGNEGASRRTRVWEMQSIGLAKVVVVLNFRHWRLPSRPRAGMLRQCGGLGTTGDWCLRGL